MSSNDGQQQEKEHILTGIRSHPDDIAALKTRVKERLLQIMDEAKHEAVHQRPLSSSKNK